MRKKYQLFVLTSLILSQTILTAQDDFIKIDASGRNIPQMLNQAENQLKGTTMFWFGYQFELRDNLDIFDVYIHNDGGITISSGGYGRHYINDDETVETTALRALAELGDKEAEKKLKKYERDFVVNYEDRGVFFRYNSKQNKIEEIRLLNRQNHRYFKSMPVVWFGNVGSEVSFNYLRDIIQNDDYQKRVIEPATFVLSLHKSPAVIPFLTKLAASDAYLDIRENAAFWLSQIPGKESFKALQNLYKKENNRDMKEKLIFCFSQHDDSRSLKELETIARTDRDYEMREKAIFWIGQNDSPVSLDFLQRLLKEANRRDVKEKIIFSISQHDSERAVNLLIDIAKKYKDSEVRQKAIFWLGQMASKKTLEALGEIVEGDDLTDIKENAVFAISQHDDEQKAADMLIQIARTNSNPHIRSKAIFWLGQTGDERAVNFFKDILVKD